MRSTELENLREIKLELISIELRQEELRSTLEKITVDTTREPVQSSSNREDLLANLIDNDIEYNNRTIELYALRRLAEEQIERMKRVLTYRDVIKQKQYLTLRYINCLTNAKISELMDLSERSIYRIKSRAETNFDKFHEE